MQNTWVLAKRELKSFFDSLMAYIMLIIFIGFSGFFTWLFGQDVFFMKQASMQSFFQTAYWTLFFFIPALTMKLIAEERRTGTIELLFTKPITDWEILFGKFLSALMLIAIAVSLSLPYYISIASLGPIDHGSVWTGYLGLILMSGAYVSIGLFCSSVSNNQIVSFLLALFIGIFFHFLFGMIASGLPGLGGKIFDYLSMQSHYESISRGVIDLGDIVYFLSVIFFGLVASEVSLAKRNLSN